MTKGAGTTAAVTKHGPCPKLKFGTLETGFCFLETSESTFHDFPYHTNQFIKLPTHNQSAKVTKFIKFH